MRKRLVTTLLVCTVLSACSSGGPSADDIEVVAYDCPIGDGGGQDAEITLKNNGDETLAVYVEVAVLDDDDVQVDSMIALSTMSPGRTVQESLSTYTEDVPSGSCEIIEKAIKSRS